MIPLGPDPAAPAERPIDGFRDAYREPLNAGPESCRIVTLDEEVKVVRLNAVLKQPERRDGRPSERGPRAPEDVVTSQGRGSGTRAQRHMDRTTCHVRPPAAMRNRPPTRARLAPCAGTTATPGPRSEPELAIGSRSRLESATIRLPSHWGGATRTGVASSTSTTSPDYGLWHHIDATAVDPEAPRLSHNRNGAVTQTSSRGAIRAPA